MLPKYKDIAELIKKGATVEAQEQIMVLREAALQLQDENLRLKEKVMDLEQKLSKKDRMSYEAPFYWSDLTGEKDGPYCQQCYDNNTKPIRLQTSGNDVWNCRTCNNTYYGKDYKEVVIDYSSFDI